MSLFFFFFFLEIQSLDVEEIYNVIITIFNCNQMFSHSEFSHANCWWLLYFYNLGKADKKDGTEQEQLTTENMLSERLVIILTEKDV